MCVSLRLGDLLAGLLDKQYVHWTKLDGARTMNGIDVGPGRYLELEPSLDETLIEIMMKRLARIGLDRRTLATFGQLTRAPDHQVDQ